MLVEHGRLELTMPLDDWLARSEALQYVTFVPIDNAIALRSVRLGVPFHPDPADRIIVATAQSLGASLVTKDRRIRTSRAVAAIW